MRTRWHMERARRIFFLALVSAAFAACTEHAAKTAERSVSPLVLGGQSKPAGQGQLKTGHWSVGTLKPTSRVAISLSIRSARKRRDERAQHARTRNDLEPTAPWLESATHCSRDRPSPRDDYPVRGRGGAFGSDPDR